MENAKQETLIEVKNKADEIRCKIGKKENPSEETIFHGILGILDGIGCIKSVQMGRVSASKTENNIVISEVNPEKCIVLLENSVISTHYAPLNGFYAAETGITYQNNLSYLISLGAEELIIGRNNGTCLIYTETGIKGTAYNGYVSWKVIEFY